MRARGATRRSTAIGLLAAFGALAFFLRAAPARAAPACAPRDFDSARYTVCSFDARRDDIRLYWADAHASPTAVSPRLPRR